MAVLEASVVAIANWIWGWPLLVLLSGGGLYFFILSRALPLRRLGHAINVLRGRYDHPDDPGEVSHYKALSVALAGTIGLGNIAGVAAAVRMGGPGIVFWMWVAALIGMATKYFTCTLAVMYRGRDRAGQLQGGPMYVITEGLGPRWKPLAIFFCVAGLFGCLPIYSVNQLTQAISDIILAPVGIAPGFGVDLTIGVCLLGLTFVVIIGGLSRISDVVATLVPVMVGVYFIAVLGIVLLNYQTTPAMLGLILSDAFRGNYINGDAVLGSGLGALIVLGARRATFSNEAGIGTASMAHGAAKAGEPVHEGLVAMLGPVIDTLVVCTLTALAILSTGVWQTSEADGISLTAQAFSVSYPGVGPYILMAAVAAFGVSSVLSYSYFGMKCFAYLFGAERTAIYQTFYIASIPVAAVASLALILNFIDIMFALMAIPTMISAILLSPHVRAETIRYFKAKPFARERVAN